MKKILVLCTILLGVCLCGGCGGGGIFTIDSISHSETRLEQIIELAKENDKESFKKLYSTNALEEAEDFDIRIDCFFKLLHGGVEYWHMAPGGETKETHVGTTKAISRFEYKIESQGEEYRIFLYEITVDTENSDEVGMYMVQMYTPGERSMVFDHGEEKVCAGINLSDELLKKVSAQQE